MVHNTGIIAIHGHALIDPNLAPGDDGPKKSFRYPKKQADEMFVEI
jgi:hypothetical protein